MEVIGPEIEKSIGGNPVAVDTLITPSALSKQVSGVVITTEFNGGSTSTTAVSTCVPMLPKSIVTK